MPRMRRESKTEEKIGAGSQTLMRGLDVIELVARRNVSLAELSEQLGLTKSTAHRLATALIDRGFLSTGPRGSAYRLGPKLMELGEVAQRQNDVVRVARPHIEDLAEKTEDTVHLGVLDNSQALYLDKVPGSRRISISSRIGERQPLTTTGLGKALILDHGPDFWREIWQAESGGRGGDIAVTLWLDRMSGYVAAGRTFDLEENEDRIRCVAAPIRGGSGQIVAAISVSSAAQYMDDRRMEALSDVVRSTAAAISLDLGYRPRD